MHELLKQFKTSNFCVHNDIQYHLILSYSSVVYDNTLPVYTVVPDLRCLYAVKYICLKFDTLLVFVYFRL
jgi:hypothetical protein